jgi:hypothetical protein
VYKHDSEGHVFHRIVNIPDHLHVWASSCHTSLKSIYVTGCTSVIMAISYYGRRHFFAIGWQKPSFLIQLWNLNVNQYWSDFQCQRKGQAIWRGMNQHSANGTPRFGFENNAVQIWILSQTTSVHVFFSQAISLRTILELKRHFHGLRSFFSHKTLHASPIGVLSECVCVHL